MASVCGRLAKRASASSIRSIAVRASSATRPLSSSSSSVSISTPLLRRLSLSRCQGQLGCAQSLLPLQSAVAAARMISCLTATSRACRALSQELGLSVPR